MERFKRCPAIVLTMICIVIALHPCLSSENQKPLTIAESSNFTETSKHADVIRFIEELQKQTPLLRVEQ